MPGPGENYYGQFVTQNHSTGALQAADTLPVATATRNGVDDGAFTLTVASLATGRYLISGVIPSGYAPGDTLGVSYTATVSTVAMGGIVSNFVLSEPLVPTTQIFPFYMALSTDGRSPAINKTIAATRNPDNAGFEPCANTNAITETGGGWYAITLTVADLTFTSACALQFSATGCDSTLYTLLAD